MRSRWTQEDTAKQLGLAVSRDAGGGERALWCAVLEQAFADATDRAKWRGGVHRNASIEDDRRYLTEPSHDLQEVCDLAGVDWRFVVRKSRELFEGSGAPRQQARPDPNAPLDDLPSW